jgi:octaprenyl-diphosphate synthase
MCEGELLQVCERENISLLKENYLLIIKHKTASLFAASCQAGAMLSNSQEDIHGALKEYGLNLGIAFQIVDDCLDLIGGREILGKAPGADFKMGELTLPVLNLLSQSTDRHRLISLVKQADKQEAFKEIRQGFMHSKALLETKTEVNNYIKKAKCGLNKLGDSDFKQGLFSLTEYVVDRITSALLN